MKIYGWESWKSHILNNLESRDLETQGLRLLEEYKKNETFIGLKLRDLELRKIKII